MRGLLLVFLCLPVFSWAAGDVADPYANLTEQDNGYNEDLETPWVEIETRVKGGPKESDLTELEIQQLPPGMTLYADLRNLSVDERDHVARLWVVIRSARGAYNGSYEGIRCATHEYKVYAYYNPKRSTPLRMVKLPRWRPLRPLDYRMELAREVLCSDTNPREPDAVRARPQHESSDYRSPYE